ncbi:MAG: UvrB/UvrC motif-containing protein [Phycisphaerales bacterium]|nr:UvrB/UvrC motif-containing protein [Phycisphaerales bacterium]
MSDSNPSWDLSDLLNQWAYEPGKLNVRVIMGTDGEPRIQMRLDLGVLQMHMEGRPDGQRPRGFESLLDYHEARLDNSPNPGGSTAGDAASEPDAGAIFDAGVSDSESESAGEADAEGDGGASEPTEADAPRPRGERFTLTPDDCRELREEAVQYYHRYMALLVLEDYEGVVRDTTRNLRVLDLCARYAEAEDDRAALEPFRAYITMMRARALASQALKDNEPKAALHAIDEGLDALRQHFASTGQDGAFEASGEVQMLRGMRESLVPKLPTSPRAELKKRLDAAVRAENYELAAILRDELKAMGE